MVQRQKKVYVCYKITNGRVSKTINTFYKSIKITQFKSGKRNVQEKKEREMYKQFTEEI